MSILGKLSGKSLKVKIGEIELDLKPLTLGEKDTYKNFIVSTSKTLSEQTDALHEFIVAVLKKSYPSATEEEINGIGFDCYDKLTEGVLKLHGMEVSKEDLEKIKEARLKNVVSEVRSQKES